MEPEDPKTARRKDESGEREPYETPEVTFVELDVEEALMAICTTGSGNAPMPMCSSCFSS
jgi:hypothetical protein